MVVEEQSAPVRPQPGVASQARSNDDKIEVQAPSATLILTQSAAQEQATPSQDTRRNATPEEIESLPHVVDTIPGPVWTALLVGAAERLTYYCVTPPWQNYMQNPQGSDTVPGALGLGQSTATSIYNAFYFFSFLAPLPFAIVSDTWLGRYKTLIISFGCYLAGTILLFITSLPSLLDRGAGVGGLAASMVLIGLGVGGVKATISPFIGDQLMISSPQLIVLKNGQRAVTDRTLTLQYIYNVFYWLTNIVSLSLIASTYLERKVSFWSAYLLGLCSFSLARSKANRLAKLPPQGDILAKAAKVLYAASKGRFRMDSAKPRYQLEKYGHQVPWNDHFIAEMKRGLLACRVMACFALFYLGVNQISNNLISQAGQMELTGIPNDGIQALNPIACVILGPVLQSWLYPFLVKRNISFGPILRMTFAFVTMAMGQAYAAGVQKWIYSVGPCYDRPLACPDSKDGAIPNQIVVWVQVPVYFLIALAEILGFTTLSEYSYSKAPKDMRTVVQALRQITAGVGSALGIALSPVAVDPKILWLYVSLAVSMMITAPLFWVAFRKYDKIDKELNDLDLEEEEHSTGQEKA